MSLFITFIKSFRYIDFSFFKRKKILDIIRADWGKDIQKDRDYKKISIYCNSVKNPANDKYVDENTWDDLNMNHIFSKIDRNVSTVGSQYLYNLMHRYEKSRKIHKTRFDQYGYFLQNKTIREKILVCLYKLRHKNTYYLPDLIFKEVPDRPKFPNVSSNHQ